jgi:hypothetical protein
LRSVDRKNPDFWALFEPARKNFGVCNAKITDFEQALKAQEAVITEYVRQQGRKPEEYRKT